jgi:ABC-type uncharacterized transport system auxiliary subunit
MKGRFPNRIFSALLSICLALSSVDCALTSKAEVLSIRYFCPEVLETSHVDSHQKPTGAWSSEVKLGRVSSGPNLRERIAYRTTVYELKYYDHYRWTERPESYMRREITYALLSNGSLRRVLSNTSPILDVDLLDFEELYLPTSHAVRIRLNMVVTQGTEVLFERMLMIDSPVVGAAPEIDIVVAAMATALKVAAGQITDHVATVLRKKDIEQLKLVRP